MKLFLKSALMVSALFSLVQEQTPTQLEKSMTNETATTLRATFSMYWYWTGEAILGRVPGIISSRIGHLDGNEIVEVEYDPAKTNLKSISKALKDQSSFYALIVKNKEEAAKAKIFLKDAEIEINSSEPRFVESKYSLKTQHPDLYYLDLTEPQAIALNSWSYFGGRMPEVLTPEQKTRHEKLKTKLRSGNPSYLHPKRAGKELQAYREQLVRWLEE